MTLHELDQWRTRTHENGGYALFGECDKPDGIPTCPRYQVVMPEVVRYPVHDAYNHELVSFIASVPNGEQFLSPRGVTHAAKQRISTHHPLHDGATQEHILDLAGPKDDHVDRIVLFQVQWEL